MDNIKLLFGDCIDLMRQIPDASVDAIITDPPYGITRADWDKCVDLCALWSEIRRIRKPNAPTVVFCAGKFQYELYASNSHEWRYNWIWEKTVATGFLDAKKRPMKIHEVISVFYGKKTKYTPQTSPTCGGKRRARNGGNSFLYTARNPSWRLPVQNYPTDVLFFPKNQADLHPTAKPVELCEYLIRTYTDVGDVVLDPFAGGGAVPVAAARTGRRCIGIEKTEKWYEYAKTRLENEAKQTKISWW